MKFQPTFQMRALATAGLALTLAACGGGNESSSARPDASSSGPTERALAAETPTTGGSTTGITVEQAGRFLAQAGFGPTDAEISRVRSLGYSAWIDAQLNMTPRSIKVYADQFAESSALDDRASQGDVINGIWAQMLTDPAQLRQRVAYALSQIFVVSLIDGGVHHNAPVAAAYYDMLATQGLGKFRDFLETTTRHSVMAKYLSMHKNQKADPLSGRVPDENFAREIMQLFSIGLHELNQDGTLKLVDGKPVETYGPDDIAGLAKVFTGFSWKCPSDVSVDSCFRSSSGMHFSDPLVPFKPLVGFAKYHSTEEKKFLGVTVPAQTTPSPDTSLRIALDRLASHPNVGPFIGKQLIQRMVMSNPSPAYVSAVAAAFNSNGAGVRGDMKAVVKAVLMHPEARTVTADSGKVREPILRVTTFLRAFPMTSASGDFKMGSSDDPAYQWGQTPLRSPSVFNFFRPGYVPNGSQAAQRAMVAPEMQIVDETSVAGYVNQMRWGIEAGSFGSKASTGRDVRLSFAGEIAVASNAGALADRINQRLLYGQMPSGLRTEMVNVLNSIAIPAATSTNAGAIATAKRNRVNMALLMTVASPEYIVQK